MKKSVILALVISFAFAAVACNDSNDEQNPSTEITKKCMDANTLQVCYKGTCNTQKCEAGCGLGNDNVAKCLEKTYTRPLDVPEICDATSKGICGSDGNAWLCNIGEGKYYTNAGLACSQSVPCVACNDGTAGCGISCNSSSNKPERPEDVPETCDKCNDKGMCGSDHNGWLCGDTGYYTTNALTCPEDKPCVDCDGFIGCGIVCDPPRPTNVPETCAAGDPGICDPSGLYAWTCDKTVGKYKVNYRCSESKPCVACDDGYVGCVADDGKEEFCKTCTDAQNECINNGKQAHVCSNGHLQTWSCAEPCSIDEATRKVTCSNGCSNSSGNTSERPANVPETCDKCNDKGMCGSDHNGWLCGDTGYYTTSALTCPEDKPCVDCDGFIGCGIVCDPPRPTNVPETCAAGDPGICDPSGLYAWTCDKTAGKYKVNNRCSESKPCVACDDGYVGCVADDGKEEFCKTCTDAQNECINNGTQAHVCSNGHLKTWSCAEPCSIDEATRKVTCSNGCSNSSGNTSERPANVPESCTQRQDPGICGDDGNAWFCGSSGYYLNNSGKCTTDKPCVVCPDGYAGCDADKETFCAKHQKK